MKFKHMVLLVTLTLSFSFMSFTKPADVKAETQVKLFTPGAYYSDGVNPGLYFYNFSFPGYADVNFTFGGYYQLLWSGDIWQSGSQVCFDIWIYWSGTPFHAVGCADIVEM